MIELQRVLLQHHGQPLAFLVQNPLRLASGQFQRTEDTAGQFGRPLKLGVFAARAGDRIQRRLRFDGSACHGMSKGCGSSAGALVAGHELRTAAGGRTLVVVG